MHGTLPSGRTAATSLTLATTLGSESENPEWFFDAAHGVLGSDVGLQLHYITRYPASSCYAYVAHERATRRRPPEHFIRKLIRSPQGEPFHAAFMAGCDAEWWRNLQVAAELARRYEIRLRVHD